MRSGSRGARAWVIALPLAALLQVAVCAKSASTRGHVPDRREIAHALEIVKADPNLATSRKARTLRWADETHRPDRRGESLHWVIELIGWIAESARALVWVLIAVLIALLATYLIRLVRSRKPYAKEAHTTAPTHVQDLDIRPDSLPENIGAAVRQLWDGGEQRAALSLLYRGLLSRLAHVHDVAIRESSTEGECLRLAGTTLRGASMDYTKRLIEIWLQAVYGQQQPASASLYALCDEFAPALDAR